jgi:rubrerythrin
MSFNPFKEKGMPIEKQLAAWSKVNVRPYSKNEVHPYTRCRVILMNGIEVEGAMFSHQFARHSNNPDLKRQLAMTRRLEQQQQKMINWLSPGDESVLETTIGYEQVAVDLTAYLARTEPDPYMKQALDFALLEDFDHLYRYANLLEMTEGKKADAITSQFTEITVGRPTILEHRHPFDDVRRHYDRKKADPLTQLHALTILAGEQQTMNFYMNVGNHATDMVARGLYLEIAQIEEQHVTHYESLLDPTATWFEQLLLHEYNECYLYYSFLQEEEHPEIKKIWEQHLAMELEHLRLAGELFKQHEKRDPEELLPTELPRLTAFQSNIDYVREIMAAQTDWNAHETEFLPPNKFPKDGRYQQYQQTVNADGAPSEQVIDQHRQKFGREYRQELKGEHPLEKYRAKEAAHA